MRGSYEVVSLRDPRWNKCGRDFICPNRGALNFSMVDWVQHKEWELGCKPPEDLQYLIFWEKPPHETRRDCDR